MFTKTLLTLMLALVTFGSFAAPRWEPVPRCLPCPAVR